MIRLPLLCLLALGGCGAVAPVTAARLANLSPLTADPAGMAVAVDLPEGLGLRPGSAVLGFTLRNGDEVVAIELRLAGSATAGFSVADRDLGRLRQVQATGREWQAADPDGTSGSLSLTFGPCLTGPLAPDARVAARLRLGADGAFLPLLRPQPVAEFADEIGLDTIPPCGD